MINVKKFESEGYLIIKNFYPKTDCNFFLKKIRKYANQDFAPIMNPDRLEFLIPQINEKIHQFKYERIKYITFAGN